MNDEALYDARLELVDFVIEAFWDTPEEDDFIAVEMAFLRYLIDQQRHGHEEAFGFERVFIDEHLSQWVDDFVAETRGETDDGLFLAAALVCRGIVQFEDEIVAQMV